MHVRYTKWGGRPHWHFDVEPLGHDRYGRWFGGRSGIAQQRGDEPPVTLPHDFVMLVPADGCYTAFWNAGGPFELYVDVTTRPAVDDEVVEAIDLDLDVIRRWTGEVELIDQDEFEEHIVRYRYPPWLVEQARATATWLVDALSARIEPFDRAGSHWMRTFADLAS